MSESTDMLKLRILICFLTSDAADCNVTGIARILNEEKYAVSRALISLEKDGNIDRSNPRMPALTAVGRSEAERYMERITLAQHHLIYEGVDEEHAIDDSLLWALHGSDALMNVIRSKDEQYRVKHEFLGMKCFDGTELCSEFKDGSYPFPFIIYRERVKGNSNISMANEGFEHPCALKIEDGKGYVELKIRTMTRKAGENGTLLKGKVSKLEYFDSGRFIPAEFNGDKIRFPADALNFINMGSGIGQILHGSICIKMQCSCGPVYMPESKALFTVLI